MLVFLASLYCSITEERIWPFAPTRWTLTHRHRLLLPVLPGGRKSQRTTIFPLSVAPISTPSNRELVFKIFPPLLDDPARLDERLRLHWLDYNDWMRQKKHSGPSLAAVRLYRLTWG